MGDAGSAPLKRANLLPRAWEMSTTSIRYIWEDKIETEFRSLAVSCS